MRALCWLDLSWLDADTGRKSLHRPRNAIQEQVSSSLWSPKEEIKSCNWSTSTSPILVDEQVFTFSSFLFNEWSRRMFAVLIRCIKRQLIYQPKKRNSWPDERYPTWEIFQMIKLNATRFHSHFLSSLGISRSFAFGKCFDSDLFIAWELIQSSGVELGFQA